MTVTPFRPYTPRGRYGLRQAIRSEAMKLATLRSTLWILLITMAGMILVTVLTTHSVLHMGPGWYRGFDPTNESLAGLLVGILTMGVFGVLMVTGEYASGTIRTSLTATPRRLHFLAGKAVVAGTAMLITAEALAFACFGIGQGILSGGGAPSAHLGQPGVARAVVFTGLCLALFGLLGMGIGVILRHTAGAISAYIAIAFLLPLLLHQVGGDPTRYSPLQIMINSVSVTVVTHGQVSPIVGLLLMVAYATAALVAGAFMFVARDA